MGYVLIGHVNDDLAHAKRLAEDLRTNGIECRLPPQDPRGRRIEEMIEGCACFLVVLTPNSVTNQWFRRMISFALDRKMIIPLKLAPCRIPIELILLHHESVSDDGALSDACVQRIRALTTPDPDGTGQPQPGLGPQPRESAAPAPPDAATSLSQDARKAIQVLNPRGKIQMPRPPQTRVISVSNQKGGVGRSTSVVNIAVALALHGNRVLAIDLDPQGNTSSGLDVPHTTSIPDVHDCLVADRPIDDVVQPVQGVPNLWCLPATIDLAGAEIELVSKVHREERLLRALQAHRREYDYIFIDCPSSIGLLTVNGLVAAQEVLIPVQCDYFPLEGVQQLTNNIGLLRNHLNPGLRVTTVLLTMHDKKAPLSKAVERDIRAHFGDRVLSTVIPRDVKVAEAPSYGMSVVTYDPGSPGATSYFEAAVEIANRASTPDLVQKAGPGPLRRAIPWWASRRPAPGPA